MSKASIEVSQPRDYPLIVEKDVMIPLRDGTSLCADVYRPDVGSESIPVIMNICPYQKDKVWVPMANVEEKPVPAFLLAREVIRSGKAYERLMELAS